MRIILTISRDPFFFKYFLINYIYILYVPVSKKVP